MTASTPQRDYRAGTFARELIGFLTEETGPPRLRLASHQLSAGNAWEFRHPEPGNDSPGRQLRHVLSLRPVPNRGATEVAEAPPWLRRAIVITNDPSAPAGCGQLAGNGQLRVGSGSPTEHDLGVLFGASSAADVVAVVRLPEPMVMRGWTDEVAEVTSMHDAMYAAARACLRHGQSSFTVVVLRGVSAGRVPHPLTGLFTGFVRSLRSELPSARVKAIVHDTGSLADAMSDVLAETRSTEPVAYYSAGVRYCPVADVSPASTADPAILRRDSVVVAAGGGRGIGAALLRALAREFGPRIVVLGSNPLEVDPGAAIGRREYILQRTRGHAAVSVAVANAEYDRIEHARETQATLADLARYCGPDRVSYHRCDVRDADAVRTVIDTVLDSAGVIDLLLNVAGINHVATLANKSLADFQEVRDLRIRSYFNLKSACEGRVRRWFNCGSSTGYLGLLGELDYSSVNDFLFTAAQHATATGQSELTIGFGAWAETGLAATAHMQEVLRQQGISSVTTHEGVRQFLTELAQSPPAPTVVFLDAPRLLSDQTPGSDAGSETAPTENGVVVTRDLDVTVDTFLTDHMVTGSPTLAGMMIVEYAAQAARTLHPRHVVTSVEELVFTQFVRVRPEDRPLTLRMHARTISIGPDPVVEVLVTSDVVTRSGRLVTTDREHARMRVHLHDRPTPLTPQQRRHRSDDHDAQAAFNPFRHDDSPVRLTGMFASTAREIAVGDGVEAQLRLDAEAIRRWLPEAVIAPILLDALIQLSVVAAGGERWNPVCVPTAIRRILLSGASTDASLTHADIRVGLFAARPLHTEPTRLVCDEAIAVTEGGSVFARIEGLTAQIVAYFDCRTTRFVDPSAVERDEGELDRGPEPYLATLARNGTNPWFTVLDSAIGDTAIVGGTKLISFDGYNYLGLSGHPTVAAAAKDAIDRYGTSVSASRLIGDRQIHRELETGLADFFDAPDALVLGGGYITNVTVIGTVAGAGDLIVRDAYAHASMVDGCTLSNATVRQFPHNDIAALDRILRKFRDSYRRTLILAEGIYSVDGDIADLPGLAEVARRHRALLVIDQAHSAAVLGETGRGIAEHYGMSQSDIDINIGTLSKSFGSFGGFVTGDRALVHDLRYGAYGFVFSAGLSPADTAAALAALSIIRAEPDRLARLRGNAELFRDLAAQAGVVVGGDRHAAVVPCMVGDPQRAIRLASALRDRGILCGPMVFPGVAKGKERLRFFLTSGHTEEQIRTTITSLAEVLQIHPFRQKAAQ